MALEEELGLITDYVRTYRIEQNINPTPGEKFEFSCTAFGEGYHLLYRQLMLTTEGTGYWPLVSDDPEIRQLVLDEIAKGIIAKDKKDKSHESAGKRLTSL
ncbi:MAG: hypothetical protein AABX05_03060 [Nanoarchaeota archaeon]